MKPRPVCRIRPAGLDFVICGLKLSIVTVKFTSAIKGLLSWKRTCYSTYMMDRLALYVGLESVGQIDFSYHGLVFDSSEMG